MHALGQPMRPKVSAGNPRHSGMTRLASALIAAEECAWVARLIGFGTMAHMKS